MKKAEATQKKKFLSLPNQILLGALLGILAGLFFGQWCMILQPITTVYSRLLEVVAFPYIICVLISNLGRMAPKLAARLLTRGWHYYAFLVILTFLVVYFLSLVIPVDINTNQAAGYSGVTKTIINYLVPENFFHALAANYLPAVVIFCVLFGLTLQHIRNKAGLLNVLDSITETCLKFWDWLVKLAPLAVFILLSETAGSIHVQQITGLGVFLILFFFGVLLLTFWLLPMVLSALTPLGYREFMREMHVPLIIAASTTLTVLALPYLQEINKQLLAPYKSREHYSNDVSTLIRTHN